MHLSPSDREELVRRVMQRTRGRTRRAEVAGAVDRVAAALPSARPEPTVVLVVHQESTPDLASRWRRAMPEGTSLGCLHAATEGRHTVVAARMAASLAAVAREAAQRIGAQCTAREDA